METESLAAALEREHHEIDAGIAAFTAAPATGSRWHARSARCAATSTWRRSSCSRCLREAEPGLAAPVFVMLREHAQIWATLDSLERELETGTGTGLASAGS